MTATCASVRYAKGYPCAIDSSVVSVIGRSFTASRHVLQELRRHRKFIRICIRMGWYHDRGFMFGQKGDVDAPTTCVIDANR